MALAAQGRDEDRHDLVPDELVENGVMLVEDRSGHVVEPVEQAAERRRAHGLRQRRRPPDVRKEEAAVDFGSAVAGLDQPEARLAVAGILRPWSTAHAPGEDGSRTLERCGTEVAARTARQPAQDRVAFAIARIGPEQDPAPHGLGLRRRRWGVRAAPLWIDRWID